LQTLGAVALASAAAFYRLSQKGMTFGKEHGECFPLGVELSIRFTSLQNWKLGTGRIEKRAWFQAENAVELLLLMRDRLEHA
jgi:hypothetical protein